MLVFAQTVLEPVGKPARVRLNHCTIAFSQLYPIYRSELPLYRRIGLEAFWKHDGFAMHDRRTQHTPPQRNRTTGRGRYGQTEQGLAWRSAGTCEAAAASRQCAGRFGAAARRGLTIRPIAGIVRPAAALIVALAF